MKTLSFFATFSQYCFDSCIVKTFQVGLWLHLFARIYQQMCLQLQLHWTALRHQILNSTIFGTYSKVAKSLNWLTKENHWFSNIYGCKKNFLPCCEKAQFLQPNFDLLVIGFTTEISNSCAIYFLPSIPPRCYLCNKHSNFCIELHEFRHF